MARYEFYEARSARTRAAGEAERTPDGPPGLTRTSFSCAQRADLVLFVWRSDGGAIEAWQLLFGEQFVEWAAAATGLVVGVTDRTAPLRLHAEPAMGRADAVRPGAGQPDAIQPDAAQPDAAQPDATQRVRGVRTLQRARADQAAEILAAARAVLADAVFPDGVDAVLRATLGADPGPIAI